MTTNCPYSNKCTSAGTYKCNTCRHNAGKRDYYDPEPYKPWPWPKPWTPDPYRPTWVITNNTPRFQ